MLNEEISLYKHRSNKYCHIQKSNTRKYWTDHKTAAHKSWILLQICGRKNNQMNDK